MRLAVDWLKLARGFVRSVKTIKNWKGVNSYAFHCFVLPGHYVDRISSLLQEAERYLEKSENCERKGDFVGALSCCTEAAGEN